MKRTPAISPEGLVKAMADAAKGLPAIPAHVKLRKTDLPFWEGILRARARDEWTEADLVVAAQLARCQRDIEVESAGKRRVASLGQLMRLEMALMRSLRMGGRAVGDPQIEAGRRAAQRQAQQVRTDLQDEEYIAV
jgi:hypothetical protein